MNQSIKTTKALRTSIVQFIDGLNTEQLNEIPEGFSNNIIWNVGHVISTQQSLCYKRSGNEPIIDEDFITAYKPGSKPEGFVDANGIEKIKNWLLTTIEQLETDYNAGLFINYIGVTTRYGIELSSIEDGISFLPFHEGLHIGYMMALKRLLTK